MARIRAAHLAAPLAILAALGCSPSIGPLPGATANTLPERKKPDEVQLGPKIPPGELATRNRLDLNDPCGGDCLFLRQGKSLVQLSLAPNGEATARDQGALMEDMSSVIGRTLFLTKWNRSWTGSWNAGKGRMEIRLEPTNTTCVRKSDSGQEDTSCKPQVLELECFVAQVPLTKPRYRSAKGWACTPATPVAGDSLTPFPWVFGLDRKLVSVDRGTQLNRQRFYRVPRKHAGSASTKRKRHRAQ